MSFKAHMLKMNLVQLSSELPVFNRLTNVNSKILIMIYSVKLNSIKLRSIQVTILNHSLLKNNKKFQKSLVLTADIYNSMEQDIGMAEIFNLCIYN